jgi:hypothetical protein
MRANRTSGSMRGYWRSSMVGLVRHRQTKGAGTANRSSRIREGEPEQPIEIRPQRFKSLHYTDRICCAAAVVI